ncbi:outer membrane beta-barrel protein [Spirosoma pollinicola]|uniref:Uncharacterized protein n=1 Tax=Spirosoma pollinicola TaxID=2057025 RepID=A0A2K8Z2S5_9BACT|nr:outer membrane beta-barrel protein [Spirosoma pollinicola]AUD04167.1 hypothetical protein CWM47_21410 [Spirosoma pollinicola]
MKSIASFLISVWISTMPALAQSINRFSFQAGYLYATSKLTRTSTALFGLPDFDPKPGFYMGLTYEHQISTLITSQLELTYQQKGSINRTSPLSPEFINTYSYLSLTPMVGVKPVKNLHFLIGPQLNLLVNKLTRGSDTQVLFDANRRLEFGLMGRASYQFNRVGLTASYFKGLTAYYKRDYYYYLMNQNWQVGLAYQLNK